MSARRSTPLAFALFFAASPLDGLAADALNASQLKSFFAGRTIEATNHVNGVSFSNYFSPDGRVAMLTTTGSRKKGAWRVDDAGTHCVTWEGEKEFCHKVVAQGDGTYKRFAGDKHVVTIHKATDGNPLNLQP